MPDAPNLRIKMLEKNIPSVLLLIFFSMEIMFVSVAHTKYITTLWTSSNYLITSAGYSMHSDKFSVLSLGFCL